MQFSPHRGKRHEPIAPEDKRFGRMITADHVVIRDSDRGYERERYLIVVLDKDTNWLGAYPVPDKSIEEAVIALRHFVGNIAQTPTFYSDISPE
jgi:hypothetical protein